MDDPSEVAALELGMTALVLDQIGNAGTRLHILGARLLARTVCRQCVTCRRAAAKTEAQMMGQLPVQRITPNPPFHISSVDYAGSFTIKKGHTRKPVLLKAYLAMFVCFSSKAVHIEIISDLTTEAFLVGTNFVGEQRITSIYSTVSFAQHLPNQL